MRSQIAHFAALVRPHPNSTVCSAHQLRNTAAGFSWNKAASDQLITYLYYQITIKGECECGLFARRLKNMAAHQNAAFLEVSLSSSVSSDEELEATTEKVSSKASAAQPAAIARAITAP